MTHTPSLVHLVHPGNPYSPDPDGIVSVQRNFVRAGPEDFSFVYWGVGRPGVSPPPGSEPRFEAVVRTGTQRPTVPLSLTFGLGVVRARSRIRGGVLRFDRVESAVPFLGRRQPKILFLHTWNSRDIRDPASESRWRRAAGAYDTVSDRIVRQMDLVYVLRPDMADDLRARIPSIAARVRGFSVPVDVEMFHLLNPHERQRVRDGLMSSHGVSAGSRLVLFAGRLEGQKRPLTIPEVAQAVDVLRTTPSEPVHFLIVGTGTLEGELRAEIARRAPGRVHVLAPIPQEDLSRLMAAADAFILPSAFEGLPNVVLESLACGTAVVAARGPGRTAEVLASPELGRVTAPDPVSIAKGVLAVLDVPGTPAERRAFAERSGPAALNGPIYEELRHLTMPG